MSPLRKYFSCRKKNISPPTVANRSKLRRRPGVPQRGLALFEGAPRVATSYVASTEATRTLSGSRGSALASKVFDIRRRQPAVYTNTLLAYLINEAVCSYAGKEKTAGVVFALAA